MNREVVGGGGASIYPLTGDVTSAAGSSLVTVTGLQSIPLRQVFLDGGEVLEYNVNTNTWTPTLRACVQVNNITVSDDGMIGVNLPGLVEVNGAPTG